MKKRWMYLLIFLLVLTVEILIGVFVRDNFVRPYVGDVLVTVLICFFLRIFLPVGCPWLPGAVFLFAAGVECLQYFDFAAWLGLQRGSILYVILGSTFDPRDILCYFIGCVAVFTLEMTGVLKIRKK